jgi:transcriptional regulator with XRE-family HTH domain
MGRGARRRLINLPPKLKEIREGLGLSQAELIDNLGLTDYMNRAEISDFENGVREPDLPTIWAYAQAAGISSDYLINDEAELPKKLPGAKHTRGAGLKPQKGRAKVMMNTTAVTLRLLIESDEDAAGEESRDRAHASIEKACLKQRGMKKMKDDEYELTFTHRDETDLDEQIYALFGSVKVEARKRKCSVKVDIREKDGDRRW